MKSPLSAAGRLRRVVAGSSAALAGAVALAGLGALATPATAEAASGTNAQVRNIIVQQADWIEQAQLPDGAIAVWPDRPVLRLIWPYLANMAAMGLARATQVTGDPSYAEHSWQYLDWYSSVEEPGTGYVTDYTIANGTTPVSNGNIDSTDAYAGTFLAAAWDTYAVTGDLQELQSLAPGIAGALQAIESTQQSDGLTWAKPSWQVAYLMDNAQAFAGLEGAAALEQALGNSDLAARAAADASSMQAGIASLWNPATGTYNWAKQADGWEHANSWSNFYPDSMEQMSAVAFGAVTGTRAASLMHEVEAQHPDWTDPTAMDNYLNGASVQQQAVSYWPMMGIGVSAVGDTSAARSGVEGILNAASSQQWGWPYTTGDAGNAIVALSGQPLLNPTPTGSGSPPAPHTGPTHRGGPIRRLGGSRPTRRPAHAKRTRSTRVARYGVGGRRVAGRAGTGRLLAGRLLAGRSLARRPVAGRHFVGSHRDELVSASLPARGTGSPDGAALAGIVLGGVTALTLLSIRRRRNGRMRRPAVVELRAAEATSLRRRQG